MLRSPSRRDEGCSAAAPGEVGRVRRDGLPLHEQDPALQVVAASELHGRRAVVAAPDDTRVTLLRLRVEGRRARHLRGRVERRARDQCVLCGGQRRQRLAVDRNRERVSARLAATRGGPHQVDAHRVVAVGRQHRLEGSAAGSDEHRGVREAGARREDVEIILRIARLDRHAQRLASRRPHQVVHVGVALQGALERRGRRTFRERHALLARGRRPVGSQGRPGQGQYREGAKRPPCHRLHVVPHQIVTRSLVSSQRPTA